MRLFTNQRIVHKLLLLSGLFTLGMLTFGFGAYLTLEALRINGARSQRIVQGKDIIADILPPPLYLVETYLVVFQAANETDAARGEAALAKLEALRKDYETRHDYWKAGLGDDSLKHQLLDQADAPARAFFDQTFRELVPLVRARKLAAAQALVNGTLKERYETHRLAIDEAVKIATERNAADEAKAAKMIRSLTLGLLLLGLATLATIVVISVLLGREMSHSLGLLSRAVQELALGHLQRARDLLLQV